jgi:hypothetical protein
MIYKKHILTKSDLTSHINLSYIKLAKESIEYKIVRCNFTEPHTDNEHQRTSTNINE